MVILRFGGSLAEVDVVLAVRASADERRRAMPKARAALWMRARSAASGEADALGQLYSLAFGHEIVPPHGAPARDLLERRVQEAVESGRLLVVLRPHAG